MDNYLHELTNKIKASDQGAFEVIFNLYHESIFNFLLFKVKDDVAAEDLLQEVFFKLWKIRESLDENKSLKNYLYTIADNLSLNHIRHLKVVDRYRAGYRSNMFSDVDSPNFILEEKESLKSLMQAIEDLPEKPRMVFMMSRFEDATYQEIADRLSVSIKTVEEHMSKALKILRKKLSMKL